MKKSTERSQDGQEKKIIESFILELLGRYTAKILYRWNNKRFDQEYWGQLERNWRFWKKTEEKNTRNNSGRKRKTRNGKTKNRRVGQISQIATY